MFSQRLQHNKNKKKQKRDMYRERREREKENEEDQPVKKKPLLQTPMEERPQCRFYKEGKCHKVIYTTVNEVSIGEKKF